MKVCVCSDSHGNPGNILKMITLESPGALLFAGDGVQDLRGISREITCYAVKGNCDLFNDLPVQITVHLDGRRIFLCHGHTFHAKRGTSLMCAEAHKQEVGIVVYGHTHTCKAEWLDGIFFLNPGSVGTKEQTYAIWDTEQDTVAFRQLTENGILTIKEFII